MKTTTLKVARQIMAEMKTIPGAVDVHLQQVVSKPQLRIDVDRTMAAQAGMTQKDVASDLWSRCLRARRCRRVTGSMPSAACNTWSRCKHRNIRTTASMPWSAHRRSRRRVPSARNCCRMSPRFRARSHPQIITHYNASRTFDVQANVDGADLGSVSSAISKIVDRVKPSLPRGTTIKVKGQVESMESSFTGLGYGLIFAVLLVYLLMVVNFQSWLDPLVILMALPGAIAGIVWLLFLSHTTLSVPALMGSIMCVGVATANSILVVTFANDQRKIGRDAKHAALAAGMTR